MADQEDARRIALALPATHEATGQFAFFVGLGEKQKGFAWAWNERIAPKKPRVPNPGVIAVRVSGQLDKETLLASDETKFFTEPHYTGFPAVLVRLAEVDSEELTELVTEAWRCQAPKKLVKEFDEGIG